MVSPLSGLSINKNLCSKLMHEETMEKILGVSLNFGLANRTLHET